MLSDLELFDNPASSALTFLRIFTARSFILDVDKIYQDRGVGRPFYWTYSGGGYFTFMSLGRRVLLFGKGGKRYLCAKVFDVSVFFHVHIYAELCNVLRSSILHATTARREGENPVGGEQFEHATATY